MRQRRHGFTLVELLVVIGIIALLISVLMPALNAARSSARLVRDQSNFKQIYSGVLMYANANKGLLPYHSTPGTWGASGTNPDIIFEVAQQLGYTNTDNTIWESVVPEVFRCAEAPNGDEFAVWNSWVQHDIAFNPRAFPSYETMDPAVLIDVPDYPPTNKIPANIEYPQRKLHTIKDSATKIAMWEDGMLANWNLCPEPTNNNTDGWRWSWGHMFCDPPRFFWDNLDTPIDGGPIREGSGFYSGDGCTIRYRHKNDTMGVFAFFDGHVEARKIGAVMRREFCITRHVGP
jgi:prepilin-type N-terminal cleavage/methylation domain-containing protein/prepilin-type processing-associated H-X9-DG protein